MSDLRIIILGSAAGGGLPQWNCACVNCDKARRGEIPSRTQSSIALSADGQHWVIANASPDLREQLARTPALWPTELRKSPIKGVLVTNGDIDHIAGLLTLREKTPFDLYATAEIHGVLADNRIFDALDRSLVPRRTVALGAAFEILPGLMAELFAVPGKVPLYLESGEVDTALEGEQTVGVAFSAGASRALYIPGCAALTPALAERLEGAGTVLFDGTLWHDNEMIEAGLGTKTGRRMGHMPMSGEGGSLDAFAPLGIAQKVYVHMNNSNPVVDPSSAERQAVLTAGWTVAEDGMEIRA
ncbi:MAG: pyrroloquinoline quinone biosynthesis protein PqqB [Pseudomonadota bacterium]